MNKGTRSYWIEIIALALGLFLLNIWTARIFGVEVKNFIWTNTILAIGAVASFFLKFFPKDETKQIKSRIGSLFALFASKRFLIGFYLAFFLISSFITSVTVVKNEGSGSAKAYVSSMKKTDRMPNTKTLDSNQKEVRFIRLASPAGRKFVVSAEGYSKDSFTVFPWIGKRINLDEDLTPSLALWIRFPSTLVNTLLDQCRLLICHNEDTLYNVQTESGFGSILIGRKLSVSDERLSSWRREASIYFDVDGPDLEMVLLGWQNVRHVNPDIDLNDIDGIDIFLNHLSGLTLAKGTANEPSGAVIDILLKKD